MRFSLHSPARNAGQITRRAEAAEALGFHALFFADGHLNNLDGFQAMTVCALRTERLRFGIAATTMAYRDPTTLALSAATSNEFSRRRRLGKLRAMARRPSTPLRYAQDERWRLFRSS